MLAGYHASRSAYMLVYTRRYSEEECNRDIQEEVFLPRNIVNIVSEDNLCLKRWIDTVEKQKVRLTYAGLFLQKF